MGKALSSEDDGLTQKQEQDRRPMHIPFVRLRMGVGTKVRIKSLAEPWIWRGISSFARKFEPLPITTTTNQLQSREIRDSDNRSVPGLNAVSVANNTVSISGAISLLLQRRKNKEKWEMLVLKKIAKMEDLEKSPSQKKIFFIHLVAQLIIMIESGTLNDISVLKNLCSDVDTLFENDVLERLLYIPKNCSVSPLHLVETLEALSLDLPTSKRLEKLEFMLKTCLSLDVMPGAIYLMEKLGGDMFEQSTINAIVYGIHSSPTGYQQSKLESLIDFRCHLPQLFSILLKLDIHSELINVYCLWKELDYPCTPKDAEYLYTMASYFAGMIIIIKILQLFF